MYEEYQYILSKYISQTSLKTSYRIFMEINISKVKFKDNFIKILKKNIMFEMDNRLSNDNKFHLIITGIIIQGL